MLSSETVRAATVECRFLLAGFAPAAALASAPLASWLAAGHAADMEWMHRRLDERLDPRVVLSGARTVIALALPYPAAESASPVARYARGRDYHYAHRDGMKALRKRLVALDPRLRSYACVDTGVAMEKVWAERAGLGWIGKNGCLIHPRYGSWLTLSVLYIDREVDAYDTPHAELCGDCDRCLRACPTRAFPRPGVVDARRCISYQTIENRHPAPEALRPRLKGHAFGCDICQEVCPYNDTAEALPADVRSAPRPIGEMSSTELAALTRADFDRLAAGTALMRAGYDGLRRNALYALGAARDVSARTLIESLSSDPSALVADAARWALERIA
ncbi:MAG: tRNA epoxyqueuosine(34) reductase QueG [Acidobacteriota bacterium]